MFHCPGLIVFSSKKLYKKQPVGLPKLQIRHTVLAKQFAAAQQPLKAQAFLSSEIRPVAFYVCMEPASVPLFSEAGLHFPFKRLPARRRSLRRKTRFLHHIKQQVCILKHLFSLPLFLLIFFSFLLYNA